MVRCTFEHKGKIMDSCFPGTPFLAYALTHELSIVNCVVEQVKCKMEKTDCFVVLKVFA